MNKFEVGKKVFIVLTIEKFPIIKCHIEAVNNEAALLICPETFKWPDNKQKDNIRRTRRLDRVFRTPEKAEQYRSIL